MLEILLLETVSDMQLVAAVSARPRATPTLPLHFLGATGAAGASVRNVSVAHAPSPK
jgi:hypothetical protein